MTDEEFSAELIRRLNALVASHPFIARDILLVCEKAVLCSEQTLAHPSLMTGKFVSMPGAAPLPTLGALGLLNGLVGPLSPSSVALVKTDAGDMGRFTTFGKAMAGKPDDSTPAEGHWRCNVCWRDVPETAAHRECHRFVCRPAFSLA